MSAEAVRLGPTEELPQAPPHLSPAMQEWWDRLAGLYVLEPHHLKLLERACQCWDLAESACEALAADGSTVLDRFGQLKPHPSAAVWKDNVTLFARLLRELQLEPAPESPGPPRLY